MDNVQEEQLELQWGTVEAGDSKFDLSDPNDKQWHLELEAIRLKELEIGTKKLETESNIEWARVRMKELEVEELKAKLALSEQRGSEMATIKVSCGYCNAELEYTGRDENAIQAMHDRFVDEHGYCRS